MTYAANFYNYDFFVFKNSTPRQRPRRVVANIQSGQQIKKYYESNRQHQQHTSQ